MLVIAADGRELVLVEAGHTEYTTNPVALDGNDFCAAVFTAHSLTGGSVQGSSEVSYRVQCSIDGFTWIDQGPEGSYTDPANTPALVVYDVHGRFLRVVLAFDLADAPGGSALFSLQLQLSHAES